jgi:hypothetical protein
MWNLDGKRGIKVEERLLRKRKRLRTGRRIR